MVHKFHPNSLSLSPPPPPPPPPSPACAAIGAGGSVCEGESGEDHRGDCQEDVAPAQHYVGTKCYCEQAANLTLLIWNSLLVWKYIRQFGTLQTKWI